MLGLDEFITEAMTSIVRGIINGQKTDVGKYIAPLLKGDERKDFGVFHLKDDKSNQATIIEFTVSVGAKSVERGEGGVKAKAKLYVAEFGFGGDKKTAAESSSLHKLKFNIPITIPKRSEMNEHNSVKQR